MGAFAAERGVKAATDHFSMHIRQESGMPGMADPMDALLTLQPAIDGGEVQLQCCALFSGLSVLVDYPMDELRITHVAMIQSRVAGIVQFVTADPVDGLPCFSIGYAVQPTFRRRELATKLVGNSLLELQNGFSRNAVKKFYVEAMVSNTNEPSKKVAVSFISNLPDSIVDEHSGEQALQYLKLFSTADSWRALLF